MQGEMRTARQRRITREIPFREKQPVSRVLCGEGEGEIYTAIHSRITGEIPFRDIMGWLSLGGSLK